MLTLNSLFSCFCYIGNYLFIYYLCLKGGKKKKKMEIGSSVFKAQEKYLSLMGHSDMYWNISVDQGG